MFSAWESEVFIICFVPDGSGWVRKPPPWLMHTYASIAIAGSYGRCLEMCCQCLALCLLRRRSIASFSSTSPDTKSTTRLGRGSTRVFYQQQSCQVCNASPVGRRTLSVCAYVADVRLTGLFQIPYVVTRDHPTFFPPDHGLRLFFCRALGSFRIPTGCRSPGLCSVTLSMSLSAREKNQTGFFLSPKRK